MTLPITSFITASITPKTIRAAGTYGVTTLFNTSNRILTYTLNAVPIALAVNGAAVIPAGTYPDMTGTWARLSARGGVAMTEQGEASMTEPTPVYWAAYRATFADDVDAFFAKMVEASNTTVWPHDVLGDISIVKAEADPIRDASQDETHDSAVSYAVVLEVEPNRSRLAFFGSSELKEAVTKHPYSVAVRDGVLRDGLSTGGNVWFDGVGSNFPMKTANAYVQAIPMEGDILVYLKRPRKKDRLDITVWYTVTPYE